MANKFQDHKDYSEQDLYALITSAFKLNGQIFPTSDVEIERFIQSTKATPLSEDIINKVAANVLNPKAKKIPKSINEEVNYKNTDSEFKEINEEAILALCRNEKDMPPDIKTKLAKLRKEFVEKSQNKENGNKTHK